MKWNGRRPAIIRSGLCVMLLSACHEGSPNEGFVVITQEAQRPADEVTQRVGVTGSSEALISRLHPVRTIASVTSSSGSLLDPGAAVLLPTSQELFVLDKRALDVFSIDASAQAKALLKADTDGDFRPRAPHSLIRLSSGEWVVADRTTEWKVYREAAGRFSPARRIAIGIRAEKACALGGTLVAKGYAPDGYTVHLYDATGRVLGRAHAGYDHASLLVRQQLAGGLLGCDDASGAILTTSSTAPRLYGYSIDGALRWVLEVEGMKTPEIAVAPGAVRRSAPGTFVDKWAGVHPIGNGTALLQFVRVSKAAIGSDPVVVHSFLVKSADGSASYLGTTLPWALSVTWPFLVGLDASDGRTMTVYTAELG